MKNCYEISKKIKIIGRLDCDDSEHKVIFVELGEDEPMKVVDLDEILDGLMGHQIKIEASLDLE